MANYQYVIPSTFQPFTMDEMLKPYLMYAQVYEDTENKYNELQDKADRFKYLSDTLPEGSKARQIYEGYANELNSQANSLLHEGLTMNNRRALRSLKGRYAGEIGQLEQADLIKRTQEEEQRKALLQNPTMLFDRNAGTTSIDEYLNNPHLSYTPYSGALLAQQTGQAAQALARSLRDYGMGKPLDAYTSTFLQKRGLSPEEVLNAINNPNDPSSNKMLTRIVDDVMESSGITKWNDQNTVKNAYAYARQGLWQAVGQDQVQQMENFKARLDAQNAAKMAMMKEQQQEQALTDSNGFNPLPLRNQKEMSEANKNIEKYKKYFYTDSRGQLRMTQKGREEYNKGKFILTSNGRKVVATDDDFKSFMDSIGAKKYIGENKWQPGNLGNLFGKYYRDHKEDTYDTYRSTEYYRPVSGDESTSWTEQVNVASNRDGKVVLKPVDFDYKKGWVSSGDDIEGKDTKDFKVVGISSSKWGATAKMYNDKTGESIRVKIPMKNINYTADQTMRENFDMADKWNKLSDDWNKVTSFEYKPIGFDTGILQYDSKGNIKLSNEAMTAADREVAKANATVAERNMRDAAKVADFSNFLGGTTSKNKDSEIPKLW